MVDAFSHHRIPGLTDERLELARFFSGHHLQVIMRKTGKIVTVMELLYAYFPAVIMLASAALVGGGQIILDKILKRPRTSIAQRDAHENGIDPSDCKRELIILKYYRATLLFLLFVLGIVIIFAWPLRYTMMISDGGVKFMLAEIGLFMCFLLSAHFYVLKRLVLEWDVRPAADSKETASPVPEAPAPTLSSVTPRKPWSSPDGWVPMPPPPAPPDFNEQFFAGIVWHQKWELFDGVFTPGRNPVAELCDAIQLPQDLRGMRVLDIGAWNCGFSFECERRGAAEVVAFGPDTPHMTGFEKMREALGSKVVRQQEGSVYNVNPETLGMFDIVLFLGVLYHLRYPLLAIDNLWSVTRGTAYIETHVMDRCVITAGQNSNQARTLQSIAPLMMDLPLWQFYRLGELGEDTSNWFGPNVCAVREAFESAGFSIEHLCSWGHRAAFRASRKSDTQEYKTIWAYENYDVVANNIAEIPDSGVDKNS